jgi:hypothetical protein
MFVCVQSFSVIILWFVVVFDLVMDVLCVACEQTQSANNVIEFKIFTPIYFLVLT